ncbi:MAG: S8 family peptidase [Paramuribaculum sp.]|nr:S8 family peptidase [Paramuribaculum sp.]
MKKHLLLLLTLAGTVFCSSAQNKISLTGLSVLDEFKQNGYILPPSATMSFDRDSNPGTALLPMSTSAPETGITSIPAFVELEPDGSVELLEELGLTINADLDDIVIVNLPLARAEEIAALPWVKTLDFGGVSTPMLNFARQQGNVTTVQTGFSYDGKTMSFDGTGVVCGMMDTGLDPNHINFKNDAGDIRIQRLWWMNSDNGSSQEYTPATIPSFSTDNVNQTHATHVAGIIGGSYKGESYFYSISTPDGTSGTNHINTPGNMPYYGVATGADLAFAAGDLWDANITTGVNNIIEYAKSVGKPVVVNLSLGSTTGPHDGTDSYSKALSNLGKKGIICMSAGNDGDEPISIVKTFTATAAGSYILTGVAYPLSGVITANYASGALDIWGNNDVPLTVRVGIANGSRNFIELMANNTDSKNLQSFSASGSDFTSRFSGSVTMTAQVESFNNRFHARITFNTMQPSSGLASSENFAIYVSGTSGQTAYIYGSSGILFPDEPNFKVNIDGALKTSSGGNASNSINSGACAENILSVGASVSRIRWGALDGGIYRNNSNDYYLGQIAPFSSYGTSFQGTQLPLIVGPGSQILSSYSTPYLEAHTSLKNTMVGQQDEATRTNYWGAMQGTSMSCPFVTGTIGLWLQADPTLTYDRIIDVLEHTAVTNSDTQLAPDRWGYGLIDGEAGMRYVLAQRADIGQVWADDDQRLILSRSEGTLDVFVAGETTLTVTVYDIQGRAVATAKADSDRLTLNTAGLASGVYIVRVGGNTATFTRKLTL